MSGTKGTTLHTFNPRNVSGSLGEVLDSLQELVERNRHNPVHSLAVPLQATIIESFASERAEQYDDPLVLDNEPPSIPVLQDIISTCPAVPELGEELAPAPPAGITACTTAEERREMNIAASLSLLRMELDDMVDDVLADARAHLERADIDDDTLIDTSLKQFLAGLVARLPR